MTHIAQSHVRLLLSFVACLLSFYDPLGYATSFEEIDRQTAIVASVHLTIKNLLDNIVHYVVEKVVPRKAEKEVLWLLESYLCQKKGATYKNCRYDFVVDKCDLQQISNDRGSINVDFETLGCITLNIAKHHRSD